MSGSQIAAEVAAGLSEAATALSDGGFSLAIIRKAEQPVNPWDSPAGTPTETQVTGIVSKYSDQVIDGTLIRADDRKVTIAATGIAPTEADSIKIDETTYSIVSVMELAPAGVALKYDIQARA